MQLELSAKRGFLGRGIRIAFLTGLACIGMSNVPY